MYLDICNFTKDNKQYKRVLLRESYREDGKIKKKTIANLSNCTEEQIEAIKFALKNSDKIEELKQMSTSELIADKSVGSVSVLYQIMNRLGIIQALGNSELGKIASWLVISRVIDQGSRRSSYNLLDSHAGKEILSLPEFNKNKLYDCLDWLNSNQQNIEDRLYESLSQSSTIYLYDVSSTYLEGEQNELAAYGYNRDKKKGKMQVVYGLLTDSNGIPISIEVFEGNTKDNLTVYSQLEKLKSRFKCKNVTFVGDKGMIKSVQIEDLATHGFNYITTISKPEIRSLINKDVIQLELFDNDLVDIVHENVRYIYRKNAFREFEIKKNREQRIEKFKKKIEYTNEYLSEHPKAKVEIQERNLVRSLQKLRLEKFMNISFDDNTFSCSIDNNALTEECLLDGCYVMKTDLNSSEAEKQIIHDRYKDLALVEKAFRNFKKSFLEAQPVYVRKKDRTRAHFFIISLAYRVSKYIDDKWKNIGFNIQEGLIYLNNIVSYKQNINNTNLLKVLAPNEVCKKLLKELNAVLPKVLPYYD